ncbi:MAG: amidohydrolase family protein [Alphaproteobacteria bacterium]|nr:amidohydrolase family protein [Alphaproteobacteria bacterium]MBL7096751.1 amidohydrolase family protein [Alphaproteobacteria bacterium]
MRLLQAAVLAIAMIALTVAAFADDDDDVPPTPPPPSVDAKFTAYAQPVIAFTHAEIVDGTGGKPRYDQTLIVKDGRIAALGPAARTPVPKGATVIDGHGKTLLPGFVMVHEHLFYPMGTYGARDYAALPASFARLYLAGGTTTARTGGSMAPYADINLKLAIDKGDAIGPDLDVTGPYLNGPGLPILKMHVLTGPDDATRTVNYWADEGVTSFKAYINITRAELKAAIDAAHARGLKVTGHLCSVTYREAAELGIDNLEHGFAVMTDFYKGKQPDLCPPRSQQALADVDENSPEFRSLIQTLIAHHVALTSTLTVFETFTPGRPEAPEAARSMLIPELRQMYEQVWAATPANDNSKPYATIFPKLMKMERMFAAAGGTLIAGTDPTGYGGVIPGFSGKREVQLLVEAGFSFPEALKLATLNGAHYLGRDADVGSLTLGKRADILLVDGDPMKDTAALDRMPFVFKKGVGYNTAAIFDEFRGKVGLY